MAQANTLSMLEKLPYELQLQIFNECQNASLIFASPRLHELVDFPSVKNTLVTTCCQNDLLTDRKPNYAHSNLRMLLQEKWISMGWVWQALWDWNERHIRSAFDDLLEVVNNIQPQSLEGVYHMQDKVERFLQDARLLKEPLMRKDHAWKTYRLELEVKLPTGPGSEVVICCFNIDLQPKFEAPTILAWVYRAQLAQQDPDTDWKSIKNIHAYSLMDRKFVSQIHSYTVFPDIYLSGPWTQSEGDLLSFFMGHVAPSHSMCAGWTAQLAKIEGGLMKAIQSGCLPAMAVFGGSVTSEWKNVLKPETILPDSQSAFANSTGVQSSRWSRINIIPFKDTIAGFHWKLAHVQALIERAEKPTSSPLWSELVYELYDELHSADRMKMNGNSELCSLAMAFLSKRLKECPSWEVAQRARNRSYHKRNFPKTKAWGFKVCG